MQRNNATCNSNANNLFLKVSGQRLKQTKNLIENMGRIFVSYSFTGRHLVLKILRIPLQFRSHLPCLPKNAHGDLERFQMCHTRIQSAL